MRVKKALTSFDKVDSVSTWNLDVCDVAVMTLAAGSVAIIVLCWLVSSAFCLPASLACFDLLAMDVRGMKEQVVRILRPEEACYSTDSCSRNRHDSTVLVGS